MQDTNMSAANPTNSEWYRDIAWILIAIASVMQIARVVGMTAAHGELPFLSANDRSRWSAMAALTEDGKWEIDRVIEILDSKGKSKIWNTIDMVRHPGPYGSEHFYSSKPPLLTAMYALVCKPVCMITGKKLTEEPFLIGRIVMLIVNVIPLILWWVWWHRWLQANVNECWSKFMLLNMALWGTFLTTFAATLNNHLHGALFFTLSLAWFWSIAERAKMGRDQDFWVWLGCGLWAGLTVACELPALAWAAALGALLILIDVRKMLFGYGFGTFLIAVAFLATNYWAHHDLRPPYSHRGVGSKIASVAFNGQSDTPDIKEIVEQVNRSGMGYQFSDQSKIIPARLTDVRQLIDESNGQRVAIKKNESSWDVFRWDDWYDFPKSYWLPGNRKGVDIGEPNRAWYILQFTIGHHGIFSLTPFWLLSGIGAALWIARGNRGTGHLLNRMRSVATSNAGLALALSAVTVACFVFYSSRPVEDRNYAGVCSGFRWVFWLAPAWLWLSVPAVESAARTVRLRQWVCLALLISVFSATVPWPNPWTHPWPYRVGIWLYPEKVDIKP